MTSYIVSQIKQSDKRAQKQHCALLSKVGLPTEQPTDFALGIYDDNYDLIATGSLFDNQLHSIAVDLPHQGKGLLNQIITQLYELRFQTGHHDLYITVHNELAPIFKSLGFHEIKSLCQDTVYMGNHFALNHYQG